MVAKNSIESVCILLGEMEPILLAAGVPPQQINLKPCKYVAAANVFDWLHEISLSREYKVVKDVWLLVKPETWAYYTLFEVTDLAEQVLLEDAGKKLIKLWRTKRPRLLGAERPKKDAEAED